MCASCAVSSLEVSAVRLRTVSPVARSSRRARSANAVGAHRGQRLVGGAQLRAGVDAAAFRAAATRRSSRCARASSTRSRVRPSRSIASRYRSPPRRRRAAGARLRASIPSAQSRAAGARHLGELLEGGRGHVRAAPLRTAGLDQLGERPLRAGRVRTVGRRPRGPPPAPPRTGRGRCRARHAPSAPCHRRRPRPGRRRPSRQLWINGSACSSDPAGRPGRPSVGRQGASPVASATDRVSVDQGRAAARSPVNSCTTTRVCSARGGALSAPVCRASPGAGG